MAGAPSHDAKAKNIVANYRWKNTRSEVPMQFHPTKLEGVWRIHLDPVRDHRGCFVRTFCVEEFASNSLETNYCQHSISVSARKGTVRGMHYQREPHREVKIVRCARGAIWDVIIDIRRESPTYRRWQGFELSSTNGDQLYVPAGFAHGLQTLCDDVEVNYLISVPYAPKSAWGIRYDDPAFGIAWPLPVAEISEKDAHWPNFIG
jgi:dTDP-4-dehydrorhamnose 3,5-epimerase